MKKLLLILLCLPFFVNGQGWEKNYGGANVEFGQCVQQTTDGGYVVCGYTKSFGNGNNELYLIKTNPQGDTMFTKTFGDTTVDCLGMSVQQTTDGGYIVCGRFDQDVYLVKTNAMGDSTWTKTYGGTGFDYGNSVQQTTDGGYIICGTTTSAPGGEDIYLIKTDAMGDTLWTNTYGDIGWDGGRSVQQTTDGGYIVCGFFDVRKNWLPDVYLLKTDAMGDSIWTKTYNGNGGIDWEEGASVQQTTDGGYIICGTTDGGSGGADICLIKTDAMGDTLWTKTFGGISQDMGSSVQQTTDGGYILCGEKLKPNDTSYVYLTKTDIFGNSIWTKTFGTDNGNAGGLSVKQTTDGGYIICGAIDSSASGNWDIYLIKTDGNGNVTSTFNIPTPNPNRKLEKVVDILGKNIKPQTNIPFIEIYDDGTVEKRIVIE